MRALAVEGLGREDLGRDGVGGEGPGLEGTASEITTAWPRRFAVYCCVATSHNQLRSPPTPSPWGTGSSWAGTAAAAGSEVSSSWAATAAAAAIYSGLAAAAVGRDERQWDGGGLDCPARSEGYCYPARRDGYRYPAGWDGYRFLAGWRDGYSYPDRRDKYRYLAGWDRLFCDVHDWLDEAFLKAMRRFGAAGAGLPRLWTRRWSPPPPLLAAAGRTMTTQGPRYPNITS